MKKLIVIALLALAGYKLYRNDFHLFAPSGAFDAQGRPLVVLFVGPGCGEHCDKIRDDLQARKVSFEEIDVVGVDGAPTSNKFGIRNYPTTLIGARPVLGDDLMTISAALAEAYGKDVLSRKESRAMSQHFDASGRPQVVMYATKWCPYCKQQRAYFADKGIAYKEIDVEESETNAMLYNSLEGNGYPLTYVGYRRFNGYKEGEILAAIDDLKVASRH